MNRGPKFIPCFEYIPELLAHIQVSTWHVHMGAMIGISGLTCKPLAFSQNLNLYYCSHQKLCVKTRSQGTFSTQKWPEQILMIDSNWYSEIYPTLHFYCLILVPSSTSSASLWADGRGQSCRQSDLRFETKIIHVVPPWGVFLEAFLGWSPPSFQDSSQ